MLIILDRDGVINEDSLEYIKSLDEWIPIPGALEAISRLKKAGHGVVVATNQSGIARGYLSDETLHAMHEKMKGELNRYGATLDGIYYCPHHPDDHCACRKPKPGMLRQIAQDFSEDLTQAVVVGDSLRDIEAGLACGCAVVLVKTGKGKETVSNYAGKLTGVSVYENLAEFATSLIKTNL